MKSCLLNPVGTSPMVITEMVDFFENGYKKHLDDVVIISTSDETVVSGAYMAGSAIKVRFHNIGVHYEFLSFPDIIEENDLIDFLDKIGYIVKNEKEKYGVKKIYLNISGGRKVESIALSNFSQLLNIDEVWIVLNKNIANYNIDFERYKNELINFRDGENLEYYMKNADKFDPIFYPERKDLSFFEIHSINLSREDRLLLKNILKGINLEDSNIPDYKIDAFIKSGFIENNRKRSIPTKLGEVIYKYI
ncbi:MAG: CRISPR-associated protein Csx14 [Thermoplasmata archaeon]